MKMTTRAKLRSSALATILTIAAASLSACGGAGSGLIPAGNAGPLQEDFRQVAEVAAEGNGNCGATERALERTEFDFRKLPASVDNSLRKRLSEGIRNLRGRALEACRQPNASATTSMTGSVTTKTKTKTTTTSSEEPETETETTSSSSSTPEPPATSTLPTESGEGGGTEAPNGSSEQPAEESAGGSVP